MSIFRQFPTIPSVSFARINVALANTDGTGNTTQMVQICQGVANGGQISSIQLRSTGNSTAALVNFFLSQDSGTTKYLVSQFTLRDHVSDSVTPTFSEPVTELAEMEMTSETVILYAAVSVAQPAPLIVQTTFKGWGNNSVN